MNITDKLIIFLLGIFIGMTISNREWTFLVVIALIFVLILGNLRPKAKEKIMGIIEAIIDFFVMFWPWPSKDKEDKDD